MMPVADFRLYQAHMQLSPADWKLGISIIGKAPHLLRPKEYHLLPPEEESAKMQTTIESRLGQNRFHTIDTGACRD